MSSCYDGSFLCQNPAYPEFDNVAAAELKTPPSVDEIVNHSLFCTIVPHQAEPILDLTHRDFLKGLSGRTGLYLLWNDFEQCTDHDTHTMVCVYVGKGLAEGRVNSHVKDKWSRGQSTYVTFYECSNRIAKYLEQLFLDIYDFDLNNYENPGAKKLYAVWDNERHFLGTELNAVSARSKVNDLNDL